MPKYIFWTDQKRSLGRLVAEQEWRATNRRKGDLELGDKFGANFDPDFARFEIEVDDAAAGTAYVLTQERDFLKPEQFAGLVDVLTSDFVCGTRYFEHIRAATQFGDDSPPSGTILGESVQHLGNGRINKASWLLGATLALAEHRMSKGPMVRFLTP